MPPMRCLSTAPPSASRSGWASRRSWSAPRAAISALRVFIGKRQAIVSTTDTSPPMLTELVERAVAMARSVPDDPYCGLADAGELARKIPTIDLCDTRRTDDRSAEGARPRRRRVGAGGQGREQFRRRRCQLEPLDHRAGGVQRLPRQLCAVQPQRRHSRPGRRGHGHGARLRLRHRHLRPRPRGCRGRRQARPASAR